MYNLQKAIQKAKALLPHVDIEVISNSALCEPFRLLARRFTLACNKLLCFWAKRRCR
jgi:hypothetical protein